MYNEEYILNMKDFKLSRLPDDQRANLLNLDDCLKAEKDEWLAADIRELYSLVIEKEVWSTAPLPAGKRELGAKWVRKVKSSGQYKSRYVLKGYNMVHGIDYEQTFAPVANMPTFRLFL